MATLKSIKNKYLTASDGAALGVTTNTENISALSFKLATADSLSKFNLVDGFADDYNDATGVDASASTGETRDSTSNYYSGSSTSGATGGTVTSYGAYTVNEFTASGNFVIGKNGTVDYLIVGSGASGSSTHGASGGGGGGVLTNTSQALTAGTLAVVVGAEVTVAQTVGNQSSFNSQTASGGAAGTGYGGTGGASGAPTANNGGTGHVTSYAETGGGAGGAGGAGANSSPNSRGGDGGTGLQNNYATGSNRWYGWGGSGGGARDPSQGSPNSTWGTTPPSLTIGGNNLYHGTAPIANRGGGGSGNNSGGAQAGSAGVVVIRYTTGEFDVASYNNMTLQSEPFTAQSDPTTARIILDEETAAGNTVLDTDLKAYASRNNGTTFTQMPLTHQGYLNPNSGIDGYTKLMLHCDGSNSGTTFTDSSFTPHTVTANGGAITSTTQKKFGTASMYTSGNSDFLSIPNSADFNFGNGDFTVEAWIYHTGTTGYQTIATKTGASSNSTYWQFRYFGASGNFDFWVTGDTNGVTFAPGSQLTVNTWNHLAISRDGNNWYGFVNGVKIGATQVNSFTITDVDGLLEIGGPGWLGQPFIGYIDELRISKGVGRYTATFVPQWGEYVPSRRLLSGSVDISGQPAGTNMKYKIETLNQASTKQTRVYGTSMAWA